MRNRVTRHAPPATRHGLSLIEVIVALVLFSTAMIGLEVALFKVVRATRIARQESRGTELVSRRYEQLSFAPCVSSAGVDESAGVTAAWSAAPASANTLRVTQSVLEARFDGIVPCR